MIVRRVGFERATVARWSVAALAGLLSHLLLSPAAAQPANDNFANARVLTGNNRMAGTERGDNFGSATEGGEPQFVSTYGEFGGFPMPVARTIWYRWTAPTNGTAVFETLNSDFDTTLEAFTGSSVNNLTRVAGNDDVGTGVPYFGLIYREGLTSFVQFYVNAGTTYHVRVGSSGGDPGHVVLDWSLNGALSTNFFSGQFRFAADFLGPVNQSLGQYMTIPDQMEFPTPGRYPLFVFSENESVFPGGDDPYYPYTRLAVTRMGGAHGRVYTDYEIKPLYYTNFFITNYFGTNYGVSSTAGTFTNIYTTNYVITNIYGNFTWFLPAPHRRHYLTNIFAYTDTVTDENGEISFVTTNLVSIPVVPRTCQNSANPPVIIIDTNAVPPVTTTISSNFFCMKLPMVTTNIPSFITNAIPAADIWSPLTGRIWFDDYQMSQDIPLFLNPGPAGGPAQFYLIDKPDAPPVNRVFLVNLINPGVDPQESSAILPPYVFDPAGNSRLGSAIVNIMENSIAGWDGWPTNAIINLSRATWFTTEHGHGSPGSGIVLSASRSGTNTQAISVGWRLNYRSENHPFNENRYPLMPGSDYASGTAYTNSPYYFMVTNDFFNVTGRLDWAANDFSGKTFRIPIEDDDLVEFNEDIWVELFDPQPRAGGSSSGGALLGNLGFGNHPFSPDDTDGAGNFANLTIRFDNRYGGEQPAGAVDRLHNVDNVFFSTPPQIQLPGANSTVMALVVQPDSKTLIAGDFTSFNGTARNRIARMLQAGYLDTTFLASPNTGANRFIAALALQADGRIIAAGDFTSFNGIARNRIVRLNTDGSVDQSFNPGLGANATVWSVAVQSDGKVVLGGDFTSVGGEARNHVARLNADGTLDTTFDPGTGTDGPVNAVAMQGDGRVVIGGDFFTVNGVGRRSVARLNGNGSLDNIYDPGTGANGTVYVVTLQSDGKALLGGTFTEVDLRSRNRIARLNSDGSLDTGFDPGTGADDVVYTIALQTDGKIVIGGLFKSFNETRRVGVARLYSFGSVDTTFMDTAYNQYAGLPNRYHNENVQPRNFVFALDVQPDGHVMIGGSFQRVGGGFTRTDMRPRSNVARLIGGATPGPGNIELIEQQYSVGENAGSHYVTLIRTNGDRGMINARFLASPPPPGPGAAASTNFTLMPSYTRPMWDQGWPGNVNPWLWGLLHGDGNFGPNYAPLSSDFTSGNTRRIVTGSHTADVFVDIINNSNIDGDRLVDYTLYRPSGTGLTLLGGEVIPFGAALMRRSAPSTILEDDVLPGILGFSEPAYTITEGGGQAVITITRTNGSIGVVTVQYSVLPGTATANVDYTPVSGTVTFVPGQTTRTFTVPIIDDSAIENDETINLVLSNPGGGAAIGLGSSVLTIIDNDFPAGRLNFTSATFTTNENAGFALITVGRTGGSAGTLTVQCATIPGGTASPGLDGDYLSVTNTLTWTNGDIAFKTLVVPLLDDVLVEPDETVNLRLFSATLNGAPTNTALGGLTNATLVIVSDDAVGAVRFSTTTYSINENGGAGYVTVVRTGGSSETILVNFSATGGTAVPGADFTATNGTLTFGPGEVSKTFTVPILDNDFQDGTRFVSLNLTGSALGSPVAAILNIIDNESVNEPPGSPDTSFSGETAMNGAVHAMALQPDGRFVVAGEFTMANGLVRNRIARLHVDGAIDAKFSYSDPTAGANDTVRALIRQTDGRLVIGGDFTRINNINRNHIARLNLDGSLDTSFDPGAGTDNPVLAVAETSVNGARKILIGGSFTTVDSVIRNQIARLNDDGTLDPAFNPGIGANGDVYAIAVQTDGKVVIGGNFTAINGVERKYVARLHANGSLDLSFDPGTGPNASVRAIAIQLDERILIGGSFTNYNGTAMNHFARLLPGGGLDPAFTPGEGANDTVNSITVQPDTRILLGGQFTRCSGVTRGHLTRLNNDGTVDPTINFGAGANNFVAATIVQPDDRILLSGGFTEYDGVPRPYVARIYGGSVTGSGRLEFASATFFADENGTNATVTVRRRGGTSNPEGHADVKVDVVTSDGTALNGEHYTGGAFTLAFPAGEVFQSLLVPLTDDFKINPDRTVDLALTNIVPAGSATVGNQPTAVLVIVNDDSAITFSSPTYSRNENAIDGGATISIVRSGSTVGAASAYFTTTTNGTATPGLDFAPINTLLTFNPGETLKQVFIPIVNDSLIEGDETVTMELTNVLGALPLQPQSAVLTIVDNDFGPGQIGFAAPAYSVLENAGAAVITLIRTNGTAGVVSVNYFTTDGTASSVGGLDYTNSSGAAVFNDGETIKTILVPIADDTFVEGPETFSVMLTNPAGGATIVGPTSAAVTIVDNDVGLTFAAPFYAVPEGAGSVTLTVLRIGGSNGVATVNYSVGNFTNVFTNILDNTVTTNVGALAGLDFTPTNSMLRFEDGETLKTLTVPILQDTLVEGDEVFLVRLFNPTNVVLVNSNALVTILDDDTGLSFAPAAYTVDEAGTNVVLTVVRTNANTGIVTVAYATSDDTATAGSDYLPASGVLTFNVGQATNTIVIPIINDTLVEGEEMFLVTLSAPSGGAQLTGSSQATVTIVDNDAGVRFSSADYSVSESGVQATITVLRTVFTNSTIGVNYSTSDGTATNGFDYLAASGLLVFTNGETVKTFTVTIVDDTLIEGDETVLLRLTSPTGQVQLLNPSAATLTIVDNDGSLILPAGSVLTVESGPVNGAVDPGETVTLLFALRNAAGETSTNLTARLLATNGVTVPNPATPQNYGTLAHGGPSVSRPFTFTASGTNGGTVAATFALDDNSTNDLGTVTFNYQLGSATTTFVNTNAILINDFTNATPYPSVINVSGLGGSVGKLTVTLTNLSHGFPDDIDMLLVGPAGQNLVLLSDAGGNNLITNVTLTFDDAAASVLPDSALISSGTNKPTNYLVSDFFPAPAPAGPYGSTLSVFNASNPNGAWSLYVVDDLAGGAGSIANGWWLNITTAGVIPAAADLSVTARATNEVIVTSNLTWSIEVTNHGPSAATGIVLTNPLPPGFVYLSASAGQGLISTNSGATAVIWSVGTLVKDARAVATITARPMLTGAATNVATAFAAESDPNPANNTARVVTSVVDATADLEMFMVAAPSPVFLGSDVTYTLMVSNSAASPATATTVTVTNHLPPGVSFSSGTPSGYTVAGGVVAFTNLGALPPGGLATATITVRPYVVDTLTNTATCASAVTDPLKANNTASIKTIVETPQLLTTVSNGMLKLSWPTNTVCYQLEMATSLSSPQVWIPLTAPPPTIENGQYVVTVNVGGNAFFRLRSLASGKVPLSLMPGSDGTNLVVSWSGCATGYALERAANLAPPVTWTVVTNPAPVMGDWHRVTVPRSGGSEFFRLSRPAGSP